MSDKIVQLNEDVIKSQIKNLLRGSLEEIRNELLEDNICRSLRVQRGYPQFQGGLSSVTEQEQSRFFRRTCSRKNIYKK